MKKITPFLIVLYTIFTQAQTDYSNRWEDLFSYNNVKDFIDVENTIYALTDNAVFTYNKNNKLLKKTSSINGLSGETTASFYYSKTFKKLVIGYENGLIEVVDEKGKITVSPEIVNFNQMGIKRINHIYEFQNKLYIATPFAIVMYDLKNLEFGDTFFIGANSSSVNTKQITVFNNNIYAASNKGIYIANANNKNLVDSKNWEARFVGDFKKIIIFNNRLFTVSGSILYELIGNNINQIADFSEEIIDIKASAKNLVVSLTKKAIIYNTSLVITAENTAQPNFLFTLNTAKIIENKLVLGSKEFGILVGKPSSINYTEIHPEGPTSNKVFSIDAYNNHLWVVYGGYNEVFTPFGNKQGYSHFNGNKWINTKYKNTIPLPDLVHITIDKTKQNSVFISSMGDTNQINSMLTGGILQIENEEAINFYNNKNSPLEDIVKSVPNRVTIRVPCTALDTKGNLWVANIGATQRLKKRTPSGEWTGYNINDLYIHNKYGMSEIAIDNRNTIWVGTRGNGVYVFNEKGNQKKGLTTAINKGSLPNLNVKTIALDKSDNLWIGTLSGLVVFNNPAKIFNENIYNAKPVVILDDGVAKKLLGDQRINTITVDGADNKWFGTDTGGVLYTNPNGQKTLAKFTKTNSPLPSNKILKIKVDDITGKVYFVTDKGMVAYHSKVVPFGEELGQVYAYPNPVLKHHKYVTIDGRNGKHLPKETNVKILDVAGNLVFETNVIEGEQLQGGKAVWDKRNLAGQKVASGIYIVLLLNKDGSESSSTKIAIVN